MSSSEAQTRLLNFVCIEPFHRLWTKHGLTEDDLIRLENEILAAPRKGDEIPGTGGFRKIRLSREGSNKGKSGSYRVLYLYMQAYATVSLSSCLARATRRTSARRTQTPWRNARVG